MILPPESWKSWEFSDAALCRMHAHLCAMHLAQLFGADGV
jgi:hypothetical protein